MLSFMTNNPSIVSNCRLFFTKKATPPPLEILRQFDTKLYPSKLLQGPECNDLIQVSHTKITSGMHCRLAIRASNSLKFNAFAMDLIFKVKTVNVFLKLLLKERLLTSQDAKYCLSMLLLQCLLLIWQKRALMVCSGFLLT